MEHTPFTPGVNGILSDRTLLLVAKETRKSKELISVVYCRRVCIAVEKSRTLQGSTFRSWLKNASNREFFNNPVVKHIRNCTKIVLSLNIHGIVVQSKIFALFAVTFF